MAFKLSRGSKDEAGPSSSAPLSLNDEAQQLCRAFKDEQYELDEVANAVCEGGLSARYDAFLHKFENRRPHVVRRTWIDDAESEEYQERKGCFERKYINHLRRVRNAPFMKHVSTNGFLDLKPTEHLPRGFRAAS